MRLSTAVLFILIPAFAASVALKPRQINATVFTSLRLQTHRYSAPIQSMENSNCQSEQIIKLVPLCQ